MNLNLTLSDVMQTVEEAERLIGDLHVVSVNCSSVADPEVQLRIEDFKALFSGREVAVSDGQHYSIVVDGVRYVAYADDAPSEPITVRL